MTFSLPNLSAIGTARFDTVIDVRAPSEFAEDHVPGAINLPVLDDAERAEVGTIYVQDCRFRARKIGAAMVSANAALHLRGPLADKEGDWQPLIYCWRGGQRSGSFASILQQIGWRVALLEGGYRSYRRQVVGMLHETPLPQHFVILEGNTGTAKTEVLARLAKMGHQMIDLEGIAQHRGSLFGAIETPQPSQKAFESRLARELADADSTRPIVVEAESSRIGDLTIPPMLWQAMCQAPRLRVTAPLPARAAYLVRAYADIIDDPKRLTKSLSALHRMVGAEQVAAWQSMAFDGQMQALAGQLMARHYDSRYAKSAARFAVNVVAEVTAKDLSDDGISRLTEDVSRAISDRLIEAAAE